MKFWFLNKINLKLKLLKINCSFFSNNRRWEYFLGEKGDGKNFVRPNKKRLCNQKFGILSHYFMFRYKIRKFEEKILENVKIVVKLLLLIWFGMKFKKIWKICDRARERYHPLESEKIPLSSGWYRSLPLQLKIVHKTKFNREMFLININR